MLKYDIKITQIDGASCQELPRKHRTSPFMYRGVFSFLKGFNIMTNATVYPMTNDQLKVKAPAIFADKAHERVSEKYKFIPTIQVVDVLRNQGWFPVQAFESGVRDISRKGFQKHSVRFARDDGKLLVGDSRPEILLTNAHDGFPTYNLHAALFRLICSNGMIVADTTFEKVSIRHQGFKDEDVIDASYRIIEDVPKIAESVDRFRSIELSQDEQIIFANAALELKWADTKEQPIVAEQLLNARHYQDNGKNDLWHTMNNIQENLIRGGLRGRNPQTRRRQKTRAVKSINEDIRLNKALWTLTEKMVELKGA